MAPQVTLVESVLRVDAEGGQLGRIRWHNGDPSGTQLKHENPDGTLTPIRHFGVTDWNRKGWPVVGWLVGTPNATAT